MRGKGMGKWFDEYFEVYNRWGPKKHYKYYNPVTGELNLNSLLGLISACLSGFNLFKYMTVHELGLAIILGIIGLGTGIAGLILSVMNIPYSIRSRSIYRVGVTFMGLLTSVAGILLCAALVFIIVSIPDMG